MNLYSSILEKKKTGKKQFAVLVDPDKPSEKEIVTIAQNAQQAKVDYFFVGGSLLTNDSLNICIKLLKENSSIPVILFPGNTLQMSGRADAILFLSLISGRNAEMLIGRHVISAPYIKLTGLEVISTGYMLIDSGKPTAVSYMSNSNPIPADKVDIAACTAMAGEMLGLKLIFMDAGSGAINPVSEKMINTVSQSIDIPLIIGGGIRTPLDAEKKVKAGADLIVIGNSIEKDSSLIKEMADAIHSVK
ncbi:MAG: geranylgeranylglyceryl/heptaprenylglyceryl phosphate synthase [Bacteroidales bacterium]|nr:geranylgeranylglyceryl/heptaprenylglyceryl phosphate synthase [Bacteroidales bacterium]